MPRHSLDLGAIATVDNMLSAFHAAALGRAGRADVERFRANLDRNVAALIADLLDGSWSPSPMRCFGIRDPKPRTIHAPAFQDRVVHHAIMNKVGPILDRTLI